MGISLMQGTTVLKMMMGLSERASVSTFVCAGKVACTLEVCCMEKCSLCTDIAHEKKIAGLPQI